MVSLSDRTQLINLVFGITNGITDYPSFFKEAGYSVENVSASFLNSESNRVRPDLILASHRYVLVLECTPDTLDAEYMDKLDKIDMNSLRNEFRHVNQRINQHQIGLVGFDNLETNLNSLALNPPALIYDKLNDELGKINDFDDTALNRFISKTTIPYIPSHFYPILSDDHPALIAEKAYQVLCSDTFRGGATTDAHTIAEKIFKDNWKALSGNEKGEIIDKVDIALAEFDAKNADHHMRKLEDSDRQYYVNTSDAFMDRCQQAIKSLSDDDSYQGTFESFD